MAPEPTPQAARLGMDAAAAALDTLLDHLDSRLSDEELRLVRDAHDVNRLACICAIDRATLPPLCDYWAPGVDVSGVHELVGNALIMDGENERTTNLRGQPIGPSQETEESTDA